MMELLDSAPMVNFHSVEAHHFYISTIFTLYILNYFALCKFGKTKMRNVNCNVYFYNRLDLRELQSNLCVTTTFGTGKKWSLFGGGRYSEGQTLKLINILI